MKNLKYSFALLLLLTGLNCTKSDDSDPNEIRYFDRIVLNDAELDGWDLLSGPDISIQFGENSYAISGGEVTNVSIDDLPLVWTFSGDIQITDENWLLKLTDEDDFGDETMLETNFSGYEKTKDGNPFQLFSSGYSFEIYWKTK